ncbi:hypothetical protein IVB22_25475 [Bradyrhizobium sp. 190]|uniref:hypothetical protein n=1 Tax=Bradyrhizobium sp. 190 TaxID=2782658 RepID=UPI001FF98DCC|nr:hypothetical protein [Bradyrhizobium sp. 190]MCK1515848.1 hypothetical protein [Bradyrhizobium sp. 190]
MADNKETLDIWLPVIGNALAYLCLDRHERKYPDKTDSVLKKVKFLTGLGVPEKDAAGAAGSTAESVRVMKIQGGKGGNRGRKK